MLRKRRDYDTCTDQVLKIGLPEKFNIARQSEKSEIQLDWSLLYLYNTSLPKKKG